MKHIQNWCVATGGCLTEGIFKCEVCGGWLCNTHTTRISRRYDNQLDVPVHVKVGNYTKTFAANTAGLTPITVCQGCKAGMVGIAPWVWVKDPPILWPPSTPIFNQIPKTPAKGNVKVGAVNISVGEIRVTPKKPKEEKPPEVDPQMQRLLDLLDREVL